MPVSTWVDDPERVRYIAFSGILSDEDVATSFQMVAEPGGDPHMDLIVDTSAVDEIRATAKGLQGVAGQRSRDAKRNIGPPSRVAIVAPADAVYGMARMYASYREAAATTSQYHICRTMAEAREWLGLREQES